MSTGPVDVHKTRVFGTEAYLVRQVPVVLGIVVFGGVLVALSSDGGSRADKGLILGFVLIAVSLAYIGYALHRQAFPKKPLLELSADGILYRIAQEKEFRIPWREVQGLRLIDIPLREGAKLRNITAVAVSQDFFDANVPVQSWWARGPGWRRNFIAGDYVVQIAFHHDVMSVDPDELWNEIEARWRLFSGRPDVPASPVPRVPRTSKLFGGWRPPAAVKRGALVVLALLAVPAIYFWHWPVTWFFSPSVPGGAASQYLTELLNRTGVQARYYRARDVTVLRNADIFGTGIPRCTTAISRDPTRSGSLLPYFSGTTLCTAPLSTRSGVPAVAIFKVVVETMQSPGWDGAMQEYKSFVPAWLDAADVDAALCRLGSCASG